MAKEYTIKCRKWTEAERLRARNLRQHGMTIQQIATALDRSFCSVVGQLNRLMNKEGGEVIRRIYKWDQARKDTLLEYMRQGLSYETISQRMDCSRASVAHAVKLYIPPAYLARQKTILRMRRAGRPEEVIQQKIKEAVE